MVSEHIIRLREEVLKCQSQSQKWIQKFFETDIMLYISMESECGIEVKRLIKTTDLEEFYCRLREVLTKFQTMREFMLKNEDGKAAFLQAQIQACFGFKTILAELAEIEKDD